MPRHTHPQPKRKHARAHIRRQRRRVISRRWRRARNTRLTRDLIVVRPASRDDTAILGDLAAWLERRGSPSRIGGRGAAFLAASPRALAQLPKQLRARLRTGRAAPPLGRLANHDDSSAPPSDIRRPRGADPRARTRAKDRWRREEQAAWGEPLAIV